MEFKFFGIVQSLLKTVEEQEREHMEQAVNLLFDCVREKRSIWVFGASHAGILTEELYYRAGGCMLVNPIFAPELMLDTTPITHTSSMERLVGYGTQIARDKADFQPGDVLIVHSVSGRNPAGIEIAMAAREAGAKVIAVTNLSYSRSVTSRHPSGKRLFEISDVVLDNHGDVGDAAVEIEGIDQRVSPISTIVGAGMEHPPVFYSANLDGGDELNRKLFAEYADYIHYRLYHGYFFLRRTTCQPCCQ